MAQHDYVISNGTGAAVRSDLNNALLAIVSQNSGATEPATMYAYQWWADTTTGLLKIRNAANNAWITLRELDGTLTIEDGTVSAPGLAFRDDLNTGIFRPGTDQFAISTNGVERVEWGTSEVVFNDGGNNYDFRVEGDTNANLLFVDASADAVGIGTTSPGTPLNVQGIIRAQRSDVSLSSGIRATQIGCESGLGSLDTVGNDGQFINLSFRQSSDGSTFAERARIDTSGRLLVGTSSAYGSAQIQATNTGTTATSGNLTLITVAAAGGDAPNAPYAVTRAVHGSSCNTGQTETIRTLASKEIAFIKIFYSWPSGSPEWKTGAYDYDGSTVSTTWFDQSNGGHVFTLGVSGGVLTLTQSVGVTMNMIIEIEYIDSSGLD